MIQSVLIALATLVGIIALAVVLYVVRHRHTATHTKAKKSIDPIRTVGVGSSGPEKTEKKGPFGIKHDDAAVVPQSRMAGSGDVERLHDRFTAMTVLAAVIFGSLGVKLWSMQVLQSSDYSRKARENLYTTVLTPAPRGIIYDQKGIALVRNRSSFTVLAESSVAEDHDVLMRLSALLGIPYEVVRQRILDTSSGAQSRRVVESDAALRSIAYISEHTDAYPGVTTEDRTSRSYPYGALAAHALGYTGTVSDSELSAETSGKVLESGDIVGKSGVEATYEDLLAGDHGQRVLVTDADGNVQQVVRETDPSKGNDIYLTIKGPVQYAADTAMRNAIAPDGKLGAGTGTAGGLVILDVSDGGIVALSNFPTYSPESFIGGISQEMWDSFNSENSYYPLMDRVVSGTYPAASTYKAFSAMAALDNGIATADTLYTCTGTWYGWGESNPQKCWLEGGHGTLNIVGGIAHSCDTVFYEIAKAFYYASDTIGQDALQDYIERFGFGRVTGIDLAGEAAGRVPTPEWKAEYYKDVPEEAQWKAGDMSNMIIGQGYVLVTPLQIACGYMGIATGTIYQPHLLKEVHNSLGETVLSYEPKVSYTPEMNSDNLALVKEGLLEVADNSSDISNAFADFGSTFACKTGTAEVEGKDDYAWFACYYPADTPKYVCSCMIEQGYGGAAGAAPVVAQVMKALLAYDNGTLGDSMGEVASQYTVVERTSTGSNSRSD